MWKRLAILAVFVAVMQAAIPAPAVKANPKRGTSAKENGGLRPKQARSPTFNFKPPKGQGRDRDSWDKAAVVANYLLVIVGIVGIIYAAWTLGKLKQQTKAAGDAAKASLLNAEALISAERPWIVLETRMLQKKGAFMFFVKNVGKSAAKITSIRNRVPVVMESLPDTPEYPPETELLNSPVLLPPGEKRYIGDFDFDDFKTKNPPWASSVQFGRGKSLYIYGRVEYLAMPQLPEGENSCWETRYCRWYVPVEEIPAFVENRCPDRYNEYK
jgi:hypothetical protein